MVRKLWWRLCAGKSNVKEKESMKMKCRKRNVMLTDNKKLFQFGGQNYDV